jgi:hypothetical protein
MKRDFTVIEYTMCHKRVIGIANGPRGPYVFIYRGIDPLLYDPSKELPDSFRRTGVFVDDTSAKFVFNKMVKVSTENPEMDNGEIVDFVRKH